MSHMFYLLQSLLKFSAMDGSDSDAVKKIHEQCLIHLAQLEWTDSKNKLVQAMNRAESAKYEKLYEQIEEGIVSARKDIERSKQELIEARKVRRNKMEYDALAKVIILHRVVMKIIHYRSTHSPGRY